MATSIPWTGNTDDKIYITSGVFTSTLKDSEALGAVNNAVYGNGDADGDIPWTGIGGTAKLFIQSGFVTSTIKTSIARFVNYSPKIDWELEDTLIVNNQVNKIVLASGHYTTTIKDSQSCAEDANLNGVSASNIGAAESTPWAGLEANKLYLYSGRITSTLKSSYQLSADNTKRPSDLSWDGTDTPHMDTTADKLKLQSGQFTTTLKTSLSVNAVDTDPQGVGVDDTVTRLNLSTPSESVSPSASPSVSLSASPSISPSASPSVSVSVSPSASPSVSLSASPSVSPSVSPSASPSVSLSASPSVSPSSYVGVSIIQTANPAGVNASSNSATYSGASIGTASPDRIVVVCVGTELADSAPTACTIGGSAMTAAADAASFGNQNSRIFYLAYPTGTTADIVVTFGTTNPDSTQNHIAVYAVYEGEFSSGGTDTSDDMDATDPVTTGSIEIPSGGGFLGVVSGQSQSNAKEWTNATEDIDESFGAGRFTTAKRTTAGTVTITCEGTTETENGAFSWIIFSNLSPSYSVSPSASPSVSPSASLSVSPSISPSVSLSVSPSASPSVSISASPSASPSVSPSESLSVSISPSVSPSASVSASPSVSPSISVSVSPSASPSVSTSVSPSASPSVSVSISPSVSPSEAAGVSESVSPSASPSVSVSISPSASPSLSPSPSPSISVSASPSASASLSPSASPSISVSGSPSASVSVSPSASPSVSISASPSVSVSVSPSASPSISPSVSPSVSPEAPITVSVSDSITVTDTATVFKRVKYKKGIIKVDKFRPHFGVGYNKPKLGVKRTKR